MGGVIALNYVHAPVPLVVLAAGSFVGAYRPLVSDNGKRFHIIPGSSRDQLTVCRNVT